jgi:hypothetical protein
MLPRIRIKTTYLREDLTMTKPIDALKTIARYIEAKKPKTFANEAEHMLDLISVMAGGEEWLGEYAGGAGWHYSRRRV